MQTLYVTLLCTLRVDDFALYVKEFFSHIDRLEKSGIRDVLFSKPGEMKKKTGLNI